MGEILKILAGTFIASAIILTITMQVIGFGLDDDRAFKFIGWFSVIATILYWGLEIYLSFQLSSNWQPDSNSVLSQEEQKAIAIWIYKVIGSILFIIITTIGLWIFAIVLSVIDSPTNFGEFLGLLLRFLVVAVVLGISLRFVSGFTTQWVNEFFSPSHSSLMIPNQTLGLLIHW